MPTLEVVSLQDAQLELSLTGKRGAIVRQYIDYIGRLESGQAGKLDAGCSRDDGSRSSSPRCCGSTDGQEPRREPSG